MNKILLILQREYMTRVRKRSFWITTLITPLLITAIYAIPALLFFAGGDLKTIEVIDETGLFKDKFKSGKDYAYTFKKAPVSQAKADLKKNKVTALVHIPADIIDHPNGLEIFSEKSVGLNLQNDIENIVQAEVRNQRLKRAGIDTQIIEDNRVNVNAETYSLTEGQEKSSNTGVSMGLGYAIALLLYFVVFFSGSQVMNGVIEEKSNRIIEVIVSSVRPIELMMGKIIGVGLVGLTQFVLWISLTIAISSATTHFLKVKLESKAKTELSSQASQKQVEAAVKQMSEAGPGSKVMGIMDTIGDLPWAKILTLFLFYYLGGYLFYSALFAAVGSAVESPQEGQQLIFPVTMPLIISIMLMSFIINEPDSKIAFWASIIPFTSPVNMMARIPFGVEWWEIGLSMALLVLGFIGTTWLAARIYRVGILMYGKKVTLKELSKWIFYKV
ncbi:MULTISPECIES: ABC transporter permease [unclassified Siphonobacter]|uniref:ABC transporter permease n=1 Tax=unclassified Siphonobacter TaxID=2635712 RepID=UPI00278744B0|nr:MULTISPECIES: ABC transporter permease [unclassified Siphonobacter]MDQ1089626.1 ABC-2 type transport system permease protein [Siphonobacter sp. SORGH_AS_1065]MDR6195875.1 ABC-2 type transport system permease protein [Siphonobacter sp. SORGH_AS_0500]